MIELFDDFRDILVELHNAGARFVVLGAARPQDIAVVKALSDE